MKTILMIIADLGLFKAFKLEQTDRTQTPRLVLIEEHEQVDAHGRVLDKVTDQAGRYRAPMTRMGMSYAERHKLPLEMRRRLIKQLAEDVERVIRETGAEECYLSINKDAHKQIMEELNPSSRARIVKVVPADLTKMDKSKLLDRFACDWRAGNKTRHPEVRSSPLRRTRT
jgi:hypothetical protein